MMRMRTLLRTLHYIVHPWHAAMHHGQQVNAHASRPLSTSWCRDSTQATVLLQPPAMDSSGTKQSSTVENLQPLVLCEALAEMYFIEIDASCHQG